MATSHGSPPPGTCHTDLSVENKNPRRNLPEHRNFKKPGGGREGTNSREIVLKQLKGNHECKPAWRCLKYACAKQTSAGQQNVSQLTMIKDNLIKMFH